MAPLALVAAPSERQHSPGDRDAAAVAVAVAVAADGMAAHCRVEAWPHDSVRALATRWAGRRSGVAPETARRAGDAARPAPRAAAGGAARQRSAAVAAAVDAAAAAAAAAGAAAADADAFAAAARTWAPRDTCCTGRTACRPL